MHLEDFIETEGNFNTSPRMTDIEVILSPPSEYSTCVTAQQLVTELKENPAGNTIDIRSDPETPEEWI